MDMGNNLYSAIGVCNETFERFILPDLADRLSVTDTWDIAGAWQCRYDILYSRFSPGGTRPDETLNTFRYGFLSLARLPRSGGWSLQAEKALLPRGEKNSGPVVTRYVLTHQQPPAPVDEWHWERRHYISANGLPRPGTEILDLGQGSLATLPWQAGDWILFALLHEASTVSEISSIRPLPLSRVSCGNKEIPLYGYFRKIPGRLQQYYWLDDTGRVVLYRDGLCLYALSQTSSGRCPIWTGRI
jgi:hypothetical protein